MSKPFKNRENVKISCHKEKKNGGKILLKSGFSGT